MSRLPKRHKRFLIAGTWLIGVVLLVLLFTGRTNWAIWDLSNRLCYVAIVIAFFILPISHRARSLTGAIFLLSMFVFSCHVAIGGSKTVKPVTIILFLCFSASFTLVPGLICLWSGTKDLPYKIRRFAAYIEREKAEQGRELPGTILAPINEKTVIATQYADGEAVYFANQEYDPLLPTAIINVVESGMASTSMLQRRLNLGYNRAGHLMDQMEELGVIGPFEGSQPRKVFMNHEDENYIRMLEILKRAPQKTQTGPTMDNPELGTPIPSDLFSVRTERVDPEEELETPAWAELSYLDAQALKFWNGKQTDFRVPQYYAETAFGRNVGPALSRLLEGGYLQRGSIQKSMEQKTIPDLKAVLSEKELKVSGKKGELVQRLLTNIPPDELEELFPVGVYEMTEKGWKAWEQYGIIFENENYGLGFSYYRLISAKSQHLQEKDADILARLLSEDMEACYQSGNRSRYQELLNKGARFMDGNGEPLKALEFSILSYFVWAMEVKVLPGMEGQNYYMSRNVEGYSKKYNLTFSQLQEHFSVTIHENKPFGLSSEANIRYALDMLKKGLSIN